MMARPESAAVDGILTKPVTSSSLYDAVQSAKRSRGQLTPVSARSTQKRLPGVRVLVVDDSELNREVAVNILQGEGAQADVACDGLEACQLLETRPLDFDVVLMDVQMPTMDGYSATRRIHDTPELLGLPVVGLSAGAFKQQRDDALAAGMDDFVAKPFEVDQLVAVIARFAPRAQRPTAAVAESMPVLRAASDRLGCIDVACGLRNWRSVDTFQIQLRRFLELHGDDAANIAKQLDEDNAERWKATAHKLVGASEVVGLFRVGGVARALERSANSYAERRELVRSLQGAMAESREAIMLYAPRSLQQVVASQPANDNERRACTQQLLAALDSDDPSEVEPLLSSVPTILPDPDAKQFLARVSAFDFRGAEAILVAGARTKHG